MIADLRALANDVRPVGKTLREVLESFRDTGGIERLMDYIFYQVAAINGFDATGHYLRAGLIVNQCATYAVDAGRGLLGELPDADAPRPRSAHATASAIDGRRRGPGAARDGDRARAGARPAGRGGQREEAKQRAAEEASSKQATSPSASKAKRETGPGAVPTVAPPPPPRPPLRGAPPRRAGRPRRAGAAGRGRRRRRRGRPPTRDGHADPDADPADALLDYLFGKDGGG